MNYYSVSVFIVFLTTVFLGFFVLLQKPKDKINQFFFLFCLHVSIWGISYFFWQLSNNETQAIFWIKNLMFGAILAPIFYFHFFILFIDKYKKYKKYIYTFYTFALFSLFANFSPSFFITSVEPKLQFDFWPNPGVFFHLFLIVWIFIVCFQLWIMVQSFLKSKNIVKQQLLYLLNATFLGYVGSSMNYFLWYDISIAPIGNFLVILYVFITTYAIIRYRLFDIKIQFQKIFNFFVPIFFSIIVVVLLGFSIIYFFGVELTVNIRLMLLFFALVLVEICKWVLQKTPFHYFFFRKVYKYQVALRNLAETSGTIVQLDALMNRIITVFSKDMSIQEVAIVIFDSAVLKKEHVESIGFDDTRLQPWIDPEPTIVEAFDDKKRRTFVTDEIEYELQKELSDKEKNQLRVVQKALQTTGAHMVVALQVRQSTLGFLILGNRFKATYTAEDIALLEEISDKLSVACMHSRMHEAKTVMTRVLQKDIDKATKKLEQQLQENQELSLVKSQFIEVASHQLRTPISVIRNSLEMVLQDYIKKTNSFDSEQEMKTVRLLLNNAFLASDNLNNTLNSILAAEEFIGAQPSPHIDSVRLESFFHKRMIRAHNLLDAKKTDTITYTQSIDSSLPEICMTDEKKLSLIIDQLLMNAIFYTKKGAITCRVWSKNEMLYVEITDTGIGIPAAEQHKLFERFVRLKNAQLVVADGAGLGLYLIRKYITLLRGHVFLCSQENEGTTVRVIVPLVYTYVE